MPAIHPHIYASPWKKVYFPPSNTCFKISWATDVQHNLHQARFFSPPIQLLKGCSSVCHLTGKSKRFDLPFTLLLHREIFVLFEQLEHCCLSCYKTTKNGSELDVRRWLGASDWKKSSLLLLVHKNNNEKSFHYIQLVHMYPYWQSKCGSKKEITKISHKLLSIELRNWWALVRSW